ncbi:hypothetical protein [Acinetobacter sp. 161(2023)]|uniref:hypothetical protein n=1 Tax=Acinetobacter sp. 161(2023) TaxID=3098768 RepID=UPI0030086D8B
MTFKKMDIVGEKLDHLVSFVEPLIQDLDLDFPIRIDDSLLVDEERNIYYLSFFTGSGFLSPPRKIILEKEGPYYFDGYENNPVTPFHWPAVEAIVTPTQAILFTSFEFSVSTVQDHRSHSEFYVSSLSVKSLNNPNIIHIHSETEVPQDINNLIGEVLDIYEKEIMDRWTVTTQLYYNFGVDMLNGLRN